MPATSDDHDGKARPGRRRRRTRHESHRLLSQQARTPHLSTINRAGGQNDAQLAKVIEHFGTALSPTGGAVT